MGDLFESNQGFLKGFSNRRRAVGNDTLKMGLPDVDGAKLGPQYANVQPAVDRNIKDGPTKSKSSP